MFRPGERRLRLSLPRRWIGDICHFGKRIPVVAGERTIRVRAVAEARLASRQSPSWLALLIRAYGLASQRMPEIRRSFMSYPWPHLYQSPHSYASVVVDRTWQGEHAVFYVTMSRPETQTLSDIQRRLHDYQKKPIEEIKAFRRMIRFTRYPTPLRRLLLGAAIGFLGRQRAQYFGTFMINSVAAMRARMLQFITPLTTSLYYDRVTSNGEMTLQLAIDHRVLDGYTAARVVGEVESILNNEILQELRGDIALMRNAA